MNEIFANVITFVVTIFSLSVMAAAFAVVLYLLIRGRLGEINTLTVTDKSKNIQSGVPFYIKQGRLTHETSYLETLATYTLTKKKVTLDAQNKPTQSEIKYARTKTVPQSPTVLVILAKIRAELTLAQQEHDPLKQEELWLTVKNLFEDAKKLPSYSGKIPTYDLPMEGNIIKESNFVDYENVFYLNKPQPLSGSSELDITLATDGTLAKTAATTEDSTFEKLLGLLPTDSLVSQPEGKPEESAKKDKEAGTTQESTVQTATVEKHIYEFSLTVEQWYVRHILFTHALFSNNEFITVRTPLAISEKDKYWYRREIVTDINQEAKEPAAAQVDKAKEKDEE